MDEKRCSFDGVVMEVVTEPDQLQPELPYDFWRCPKCKVIVLPTDSEYIQFQNERQEAAGQMKLL